MSTARILIADDHESFRRSLQSFLSADPNYEVCGEAADGIDAVEKAKQLRPALVLMDVSMPRMDGLEATRAIRREMPETKVIVISQNDSAIMSQLCAEAGACVFLPKASVSRELVPAIERSLGNQNNELDRIFPGESQMARLMRSHDWSRSEVGVPEKWPETLRTAVHICLASRHPIVLWWGRSTFTQFYNDAYISFLGAAKHPAFLGRSGQECWSEIWSTMGPMWEKVFLTGEATWAEDFLYVLNRNLPREEGYFNFSYSPLRDDSGSVEGIFCACYETTERVLGERRLRTLRDLGRTVLNAKSAEDACELTAKTLASNPADVPFALVYLLDEDQVQARLVASMGVEAGTTVARRNIDIGEGAGDSAWPLRRVFGTCSPELVSDLSTHFAGLPGGPWPEPPETAIVLPIAAVGQAHPAGFLVTAFSPRRIIDADYRTFFDLVAGHLATAVANARAYEKERERAEGLAELDRAKTAFFSNVSHEFRTPLTLMLGPLQDLLGKNANQLPAAAMQQLQLVNRNAARLLRLVNTLLDFSTIQAGRVQAVFQATDLAQFTAELASVFRSATDKAGLRLVTDCQNLGEPVYVDRDMWEKIVLNLISNAFKFTFDGEIVVSISRVGNKAELRVRDTGVGIPADAVPKLFERFHRVPNTRSRTHEGTGIGLALVQELVKLHAGSVQVESKVGEGTTFTVAIPFGQSHLPDEQIARSQTLSPTATSAMPFLDEALRWLPDASTSTEDFMDPNHLSPLRSAQILESTQRPRILFADDNADMRQYVARLLAEHYEVETVANGQAALESALQHPPNLILSDVMMPGLDGFALLKAIRASDRTKRIPVILLSARAGEESRVEGMQAQADDYLIKPFSARELLACIAGRLEISRVQQERHAELEKEVQERTRELLVASQELRELSAHILQAQDAERRRIARELHDGAGQLLAAVAMEVSKVSAEREKLGKRAATSLSSIESLIAQMHVDIRTMSHLLYPPLLDEVGLHSALSDYVNGFGQRSGIKVDLDFPAGIGRLDREFELCLFRIVQECLTNIHRHSASKVARIAITTNSGILNLHVSDEGTGMSEKKLAQLRFGGSGVGIRGMRERVHQLSGNLSIESDRSGTRVRVSIPIKKSLLSASTVEPLPAAV
ncbi:MAG TPA: response regulator [Candidatus Sulfotelmatobacter sp.]|nr:response regulator [Candidatus Sulfotelmatobacter sp.]